jgi:formylglycine-generating enzyme required for sulfatase activity
MILFNKKNVKYIICYLLLLSLPLIFIPEPFRLVAQELEEGVRLLNEGIKDYEKGAYEFATENLEKAVSLLKDEEKLTDCYLYLSLAYFAMAEKEKAKKNLNEVLRLNPDKKLNPELEKSAGFIDLWNEVMAKKEPIVRVTPPEKKPELKKSKAWVWILIGGAAAAVVAILVGRGGKKVIPPPVPGLGNINVQSTPEGALIYLDGSDTTYRTTHTFTEISPGSHTIRLVLSGFDDWSCSIQVESNRTANVNATLTSEYYAMELIEEGLFMMGSDSGDSDERPVHPVYVSAFYMDRYEVTNEQYKGFIDATGNRAPPYWSNDEYPSGQAKHPVVRISREDMIAYCRWISKRLPTEAEWEKAARGKNEGYDYPFPFLNSLSCGQANISGCIGNTKPVGSYPANDYGLYDMAGNVWEAVKDWYDESYYSNSVLNNPQGPSSGTLRVKRGGSWRDPGPSARCANRNHMLASDRLQALGFRCARNL